MKRATWWQDADPLVLRDRTQVVGHYWNVPPLDGQFCPPHPSGHPALRQWQRALSQRVLHSGSAPFTGEVACVDFNGVTLAADDRACIGALRWPERQIAWAIGPRTRGPG
ncbi:MAG: hypothetical protein HYZ28_00080 [Myxococcales bacterium]|nr:hypothetical protein [Myxococcales bacterium]